MARPLNASAPTQNSALRENRSVMYHRVARSRARNKPSIRKGSPPIHRPVAARWIVLTVMRYRRLPKREAAWFVISEAARMITASTGRAYLANLLFLLATTAVRAAPPRMMLPETKKLAPRTPLNGISAVVINTEESTNR